MLGIAEYRHVDDEDGTEVPVCHTLANTFWSALYFLSSIFLFFIIPLIILLTLYLIIAKNLISNAANIVLNKHLDSYSIRARRQVILMLGTVVLSFFLCLIPFRVFTLWIIIVPDESIQRLGAEKYYNILYFCRIMVYLNSAINPILYNLMSSKFRTGFIGCSRKRRKFYFRRSRNGTISTTATSCRSSRGSHDNYKVCFRTRNDSIFIKNCSESPDSNRSGDSHSKILKDSPALKSICRKKSNTHDSNDDFCAVTNRKYKYSSSPSPEEPYNTNVQCLFENNLPKCFKTVEVEVISLHERFIKQDNVNQQESFVPILAITQYGLETYYDGTVVSVCFSKVETLLPSLFFILSISVFFFLPLAILLILYALIAKTLIDHPNVMAPCKNNALGSQSAIKYRKQVIVMLGTVVLAFFICLLPFRALTLWIIVVPAESIMNIGFEGYYNLLYFSRIMFHINSAINPILYNIMSSKFRNGFFRLCGIRIFNKRYINRADINRKNTFNTTSSTQTSSQHTSESFWSRYSRNYSRNSTSSKDAKDVLADPECSKNNNKDRNSKDSYVRIPLQTSNSINSSVKKVNNGESYV
ncbi:hypothetical protein FQA39_LY13999 [Lamprigera yunnana]|nr:hypothetical protein FQA39_LY13999 [Lamprigera yunnana]